MGGREGQRGKTPASNSQSPYRRPDAPYPTRGLMSHSLSPGIYSSAKQRPYYCRKIYRGWFHDSNSLARSAWRRSLSDRVWTSNRKALDSCIVVATGVSDGFDILSVLGTSNLGRWQGVDFLVKKRKGFHDRCVIVCSGVRGFVGVRLSVSRVSPYGRWLWELLLVVVVAFGASLMW